MTVSLGIDVGDGWIVDTASIPEASSSLALIHFVRQAAERYARLDLGKRMFVDEPPLAMEKPAIERLFVGLADRERALAVAPVPA